MRPPVLRHYSVIGVCSTRYDVLRTHGYNLLYGVHVLRNPKPAIMSQVSPNLQSVSVSPLNASPASPLPRLQSTDSLFVEQTQYIRINLENASLYYSFAIWVLISVHHIKTSSSTLLYIIWLTRDSREGCFLRLDSGGRPSGRHHPVLRLLYVHPREGEAARGLDWSIFGGGGKPRCAGDKGWRGPPCFTVLCFSPLCSRKSLG